MLQQGKTLHCHKVCWAWNWVYQRGSCYISECDIGIAGKALADNMLGFIRNHLGPSNKHSQAYDGASNMSGKTNGAAARISSQYPSPFTPIALLIVRAWQLWLHLRSCASVTRLVLWTTVQLRFCTSQASEEVGRSYTECPARIERVEAERSLQNKMDWMDRCSRSYQETWLLHCC